MPEHDEHDNPLQGYFDWQVTTLMLARDLHDPVSAGDDEAQHQRRHDTENLVRELTLGVLPEQYKHDATLAWPPELMMQITRETLRKAAKIAQIQ
ncbi:MAG: hypothetical protein ACIAXF_11585 [Phycisphaerales bacterium JB063]